jgi:tetratricopeptide (TPR) repeat protein
MSYNNRSMLLFRARRYDEAIRASEQALELDPSFVNALWWKGVSCAGNRDFSKSIACLTTAMGMNDAPLLRAFLGHVYGRAGERTKALAFLRDITIAFAAKVRLPNGFCDGLRRPGRRGFDIPVVGKGISGPRKPNS